MALRHGKIGRIVLVALAAGGGPSVLAGGGEAAPAPVAASREGNPSTLLWYAHPAEKWDDALPVGNGCLGAMVFGKTDEEEIPINEGDRPRSRTTPSRKRASSTSARAHRQSASDACRENLRRGSKRRN